MDIFGFLAQKAKEQLKKIVFPEGENPSIIKAAAVLCREKLAIPILLGSVERVKEIGYSLNEDLNGRYSAS